MFNNRDSKYTAFRDSLKLIFNNNVLQALLKRWYKPTWGIGNDFVIYKDAVFIDCRNAEIYIKRDMKEDLPYIRYPNDLHNHARCKLIYGRLSSKEINYIDWPWMQSVNEMIEEVTDIINTAVQKGIKQEEQKNIAIKAEALEKKKQELDKIKDSWNWVSPYKRDEDIQDLLEFAKQSDELVEKARELRDFWIKIKAKQWNWTAKIENYFNSFK